MWMGESDLSENSQPRAQGEADAASKEFNDGKASMTNPDMLITERQLELIALYASGYQFTEIADMKFISYSSVKHTLAAARERVGAKNLTHLCVICFDSGLLRKNGNGYKPVQEERVIGE
jgi:DNA-binding NarL/FixJ family response regulator